MFALAALAGLRRSEILNMEVADVRLDDGLLIITERKKDKSKSETKRRVLMVPKLKKLLETYINDHRQTGTYLIVDADGEPLTDDMAVRCFKAAIANSKWAVLPGYHCLRHSFASICLRKGIPIHVTAKWMGHTTEVMIKLYQKLYPEDEREWIKRLG